MKNLVSLLLLICLLCSLAAADVQGAWLLDWYEGDPTGSDATVIEIEYGVAYVLLKPTQPVTNVVVEQMSGYDNLIPFTLWQADEMTADQQLVILADIPDGAQPARILLQCFR